MKNLMKALSRIGKGSKVEGAYFAKADYSKMLKAAYKSMYDKKRPDYSSGSNNCATWADDILSEGGESNITNSQIISGPIPNDRSRLKRLFNTRIDYDPKNKKLSGDLYEK